MCTNADKLYKKALKDQQKRLKSGECQKYVRIVLDAEFCNSVLGQELLLELVNFNYEIRRMEEENCIYWERSVGQRQFITDEDLAGNLNDKWEMENQVLKLLTERELKILIKQKNLSGIGSQLRHAFSGKRFTILVVSSNIDTGKKPEIDKALVELQVLEDVTVLEVSQDAKELGALLCRYTKAISEAPYKQQKSATIDIFKKYLRNDKKLCVRVEGTVGFRRLWQQHLNRLPMVTLDVAEAIMAQYPCPKKLLDAYENNANAVNEIADLRLNRGGGPQPLQTERRIGNVLSTKLHTLYNTRDPNACI